MKENQQTSNYEKTKNSMAEAFLRHNQQDIIARFSLMWDKDYLYVPFLGRDYRINRQNGKVSWSENHFVSEHEAGFNEVMTIYDVFCNAKGDCRCCGEWVNVASLATIEGGALEKDSNYFRGAGASFQGRAEALAHALAQLQGQKLAQGDVAALLPLFPFLWLKVVFWDADEDFPATLQVFTDKNILDFMHFETLMYALGHLVERLEALAEDY